MCPMAKGSIFLLSRYGMQGTENIVRTHYLKFSCTVMLVLTMGLGVDDMVRVVVRV